MTIVELLVAMTIFAGVALALGYTLQMALMSTRDDRSRVQAANLAARELEISRNEFGTTTAGPATLAATLVVVNPHQLPGGTAGQPLKVDGTSYTVTRTVEWLPAGTGANPCDGGTAVNYPSLGVNVKVTWPNMLGTPPVVSNTVLTPPKGTLNSSQSFVAAKVTGAAGTGVSGVPVTLTGPGGTSVVSTADDGCAVFSITTMGNYVPSVYTNGYVTFDGQTSAVKPAVTVTAGTLQQVNFSYDRAATIQAQYSSSGGYQMPSPIPGFTYFNQGLVPSGTRTFTPGASSMTLANLWPFSDGYSLWAGTCKQSDPASTGGSRPTAIALSPGANQNVTLAMATMRIVVTGPGGIPIPNARVTAAPVDPTGCATTETLLTLGTTDSSGVLLAQVPGGAWNLQVLDAGGNARLLDNTTTLQSTPPMVVGSPEVDITVGVA